MSKLHTLHDDAMSTTKTLRFQRRYSLKLAALRWDAPKDNLCDFLKDVCTDDAATQGHYGWTKRVAHIGEDGDTVTVTLTKEEMCNE